MAAVLPYNLSLCNSSQLFPLKKCYIMHFLKLDKKYIGSDIGYWIWLLTTSIYSRLSRDVVSRDYINKDSKCTNSKNVYWNWLLLFLIRQIRWMHIINVAAAHIFVILYFINVRL